MVVVVAPLAPTSELSNMAAEVAPADGEDEDDDVDRFRCAMPRSQHLLGCIAHAAVGTKRDSRPEQHAYSFSLCGTSSATRAAYACRIRRDAGRLERRLAAYLQHKLRAPPLLLTVIFSIRPRTYLLFLLWVVCCPIAARFEVRRADDT